MIQSSTVHGIDGNQGPRCEDKQAFNSQSIKGGGTLNKPMKGQRTFSQNISHRDLIQKTYTKKAFPLKQSVAADKTAQKKITHHIIFQIAGSHITNSFNTGWQSIVCRQNK